MIQIKYQNDTQFLFEIIVVIFKFIYYGGLLRSLKIKSLIILLLIDKPYYKLIQYNKFIKGDDIIREKKIYTNNFNSINSF